MDIKLIDQINDELINWNYTSHIHTLHGNVPLQQSYFLMTNVQRTHTDALKCGNDKNVSSLIPSNYNAFEKDIALVNIIYKKSTAVLMGSQNRMTWIDFFATVGGLLGLVLGMGFISFVELFWLGLRILSRQFELTKWIP